MWIKRYDLVMLIKEVRVQLDLSQEDLAREIGVSFATVNRWENGRFRPSKLARATLHELASRHGVSLEAAPPHGVNGDQPFAL